jgi:hypothetical protein
VLFGLSEHECLGQVVIFGEARSAVVRRVGPHSVCQIKFWLAIKSRLLCKAAYADIVPNFQLMYAMRFCASASTAVVGGAGS